jgi:hypothetical protein
VPFRELLLPPPDRHRGREGGRGPQRARLASVLAVDVSTGWNLQARRLRFRVAKAQSQQIRALCWISGLMATPSRLKVTKGVQKGRCSRSIDFTHLTGFRFCEGWWLVSLGLHTRITTGKMGKAE